MALKRSVDTSQWTPTNIAWLAGLYEGEGNLYYRREPAKSRGWTIQIQMTDVDVLQRAREIAGFGTISGPYQPSRGNKETWKWRTASFAIPALLVAMWPWLGERRRADARLAIVDDLYRESGRHAQ